MQPSEMIQIIARKRDGEALRRDMIEAVVDGVSRGTIPDHQTSALLMAIYLRGLDLDETAALTHAIAVSGTTLDFSDLGPVIDKHSTGGVADTVSLIAAPLAAACGVIVPMISGRALGHTGGTLDKLETIPGMRVRLDPDAFRSAVNRAGLAIVQAGPTLAPGDAALYRLRDATATVAEPGLIVASILGKKLCVSPDAVVMDLKVGEGSFVGELDAARALASRMRDVGGRLGLRISFLITRMDAPLSSAIGNATEVERAIRILRDEELRGAGIHGEDLRALSLAVAAEMIALAESTEDIASTERRAAEALRSGAGLERFARMIRAQGGDPGIVDDPARLPQPRARRVLESPRSGYVQALDARGIGRTAAALGAGRGAVGIEVDPAAGIQLAVGIGEAVTRGQPLAHLVATRDDGFGIALRQLEASITIGAAPRAAPGSPILERWRATQSP